MRLGATGSKLLALLALTGFAGLIWAALLAPAADWQAAQLRERDSLTSKVTALRATLSRLENEQEQLDQKGDDSGLWPPAPQGQSTARIQSAISASAERAGLAIRSISPTDGQTLALAQMVSFLIEADGPLDAFHAFFADLDGQNPALLIDNATLRLFDRPAPDGAGPALPMLFAQIQISAPVALAQGAKP